MSAARHEAWKTRRAKYGASGHAGSYTRPTSALGRRALALVIRLHREATLSEGQCCKALDLDRVEFRRLCDADTSGRQDRARDEPSKHLTSEAEGER